jgi:hypothetical protein
VDPISTQVAKGSRQARGNASGVRVGSVRVAALEGEQREEAVRLLTELLAEWTHRQPDVDAPAGLTADVPAHVVERQRGGHDQSGVVYADLDRRGAAAVLPGGPRAAATRVRGQPRLDGQR